MLPTSQVIRSLLHSPWIELKLSSTGCKEANLMATFVPATHLAGVTVTAPERGSHIVTDALVSNIPAEQGEYTVVAVVSSAQTTPQLGLLLLHLKHTSAALCLGPSAAHGEMGCELEATLNSLVPEAWNDSTDARSDYGLTMNFFPFRVLHPHV